MARPPLLPEEILRRVARMARFDGLSVLGISACFALLSASDHDVQGALIGVAAAGAGTMELHGLGILRNRDPRGIGWMICGQLALMVIILGDAYYHQTHFDLTGIRSLMLTYYSSDQVSNLKDLARQNGLSTDDALRLFNTMCWGVIAFLTLVYQGGMAIYYARRRTAVTAALLDEI